MQKLYWIRQQARFLVDQKWKSVRILRLLVPLNHLLFYVSFESEISVLNAPIVRYD